jgi:hypothetical protein
MAMKLTRTMLVVVAALTLAAGALGLTGELGSDWVTAPVAAAGTPGGFDDTNDDRTR